MAAASSSAMQKLSAPLSSFPPSPTAFIARFPLPSAHLAGIVSQVLSVDPPFAQSSKAIDVEDNVVVIVVHAPSTRVLRTAVHAILEQLHLVLRTLDAFGQA